MNDDTNERIRANEVELKNLKEVIPRIFTELRALPDLIAKKFAEHAAQDLERRKGENFETRIKDLEKWKIKLVAIAAAFSVILAFSKDFISLAIHKVIG